MPVFRVEKNTNYTTMSNYHLRDRDLSLKAKGLLSLFLSLPDTWDYSVTGLAAICKEGRSGISSVLKELEGYGYLIRERRRDAKGMLRDNVYVIYEMPQQGVSTPRAGNPAQETPTLDSPVQASPMLGEPALEKPPQINKEQTSKEEINTDSNNRKREKESRHQYGQYGNVLLSDFDLQTLQGEFPQDYQQRIERLSEYMASTGKSYKSHLATIRSWARQERRRASAAGTYSHDNYRCEEGESL